MNSKADRLNISIENMIEAVKYYTKEVEEKYYAKKINKKDYSILIKDLSDIKNILDYFKSKKAFSNKKLDEMRKINLSIMSLYDEGDYSLIFNEIMRVNNDLCRDDKESDRKTLGKFKRIFNGLPNYYSYRLSKAEIRPSEGICFRDRGLDNFKFISEKYLTVKYCLKKVKFEKLEISDIYQHYINECTKIIESEEHDVSIKSIYTKIRELVIKYAKAEVIIQNLEKMNQLCSEIEFPSIKEQINILLEKYKVTYAVNKEKYDIIIQKINENSEIMINDESDNLSEMDEFENDNNEIINNNQKKSM